MSCRNEDKSLLQNREAVDFVKISVSVEGLVRPFLIIRPKMASERRNLNFILKFILLLCCYERDIEHGQEQDNLDFLMIYLQ